MAQSAFRFFRGTCHLFYEDLVQWNELPQSPLTWVCGDLHLENFGSYKGDNRLEYFDLNDFDEAALAPANWELARMLTSIFTGFESFQISAAAAKEAAALFLTRYSDTLASGKSRYIETETARGIVKIFLDHVATRKQKELLRQRAVEKNGKLGFLIDNSHFYKLDKALKKDLPVFLADWLKKNRNYKYDCQILDTAFRIAGTGSIGVKRYAFLVEKMLNPSKYILVDMKQSTASSLKPWLSVPQPAWNSEAERVVAIQQRMQNVSPAFLSSVEFGGESYILKELQPVADKINFELIKSDPKNIMRVIEDMAVLTASAQLRSSGRQGSAIADELIAFGQDKSWQTKLTELASNYAAQVKKDYADFQAAWQQNYFK